jgi:hypothetical protein
MTRKCAMCGSENTREVIEREEWDIAYEGLPKMIASIPVTCCVDCEFEFTDERAEKIRDAILEAVSENWAMQLEEE